MQVVATALGFAGSLRQPGDTFDMPEGSIGSWFVPVADPAETPPPPMMRKRGKSPTADEDDASA